ncbi:MAG: glycosyltransferase [Lentilitoribacter sp.]
MKPVNVPMTAPKIAVIARDIWQRDAVGEFTLFSAERLSNLGFHVQCYAENTSEELIGQGAVRLISDLHNDINPQDMILFHFSTYDPLFDELVKLENRICVYFHNITPPEHFVGWDEVAVKVTGLGYDQIKLLEKVDHIAVNSPYTANVVAEQGVNVGTMTEIAPSRGMSSWQIEADQDFEYLNTSYLLYVGRLAPNKGISEVLNTFAEFKKLDPSIKLIILGVPSTPDYQIHLMQLLDELSLNDGSVQFLSGLDKSKLADFYRNADAFITLSTHEGFCVPVAEALFFECPVFSNGLPPIDWICSRARQLSHMSTSSEPVEMAKELHDFMTSMKAITRNPYNGEVAKNIERLCSPTNYDEWLRRVFPNT